MRALLLAAGLGTRLRPVTNIIPKCLVPINGKVLIDYWLEQLSDAGIERFLINTHYLPEQIEAHVKQSRYADNIDLVYEKDLLMTGGTVISNRDFFQEEEFMVVHADNLSICDFSKFIQAHTDRLEGVDITMMTFDTDSPSTCGIVSIDKNGVVQNFHEKEINPPGNLANGAVYIMENSVLNTIAAFSQTRVDISLDVIPRYLGKIGTFHNEIYHRDIGNLESYSLAQVECFKKQI